MQFAKSARIALVAVLGLGFIGTTLRPAAAEEPYKAQIDALRNAMEKYKDYKAAVRDLYLSTVGCVHYYSEKMAGHMHYPKGRHGRALRQSNNSGRARPDEAKHPALRTRGQGAAVGGG